MLPEHSFSEFKVLSHTPSESDLLWISQAKDPFKAHMRCVIIEYLYLMNNHRRKDLERLTYIYLGHRRDTDEMEI